ncbi:beta-galactosidase [Flammeovirga pacifica]|uniref:Beta-galactosidase n=2 Tax=Flammeovirga pacifica TaxID=915059 RepID=A0A1S1Z5H5_FLAPC|nr:beta-galactosidase [Flammeovirga pacifica]
MMKRITFILVFLVVNISYGQMTETLLKENWRFSKGDFETAKNVDFNDSEWEKVKVPHDWAIKGPFDKKHDAQRVAILQDGEKMPTEKSGRTGALPYMGTAWYRLKFDTPKRLNQEKVLIHFDGAMSEAKVYVNGHYIGEHPYGYGYFYFDITQYLKEGSQNTLAVRLHNEPKSSRWYPGAGIYRKVKLITKQQNSIKRWGNTITTPIVSPVKAKVVVKTKTIGQVDEVKTTIKTLNGKIIISSISKESFDGEYENTLAVERPELWSPEHPNLYQMVTTTFVKGHQTDEIIEKFGFRSISFTSDKGFELNGVRRKIKGVCLHHDLGPLGTAINRSALKRQLVMMKEMGADAIRTAHNMPSIEQLELCDELGLMVVAESFDEWKKAKVDNGYHRFFDEWAEIDVQHLVRATKNHPSIIMWSSGNEVPDQWGNEGVKRAKWLQDIFHKEDPTRPVTVGMDQVEAVMANGFGAIMDVPGLNYRTQLYEEAHEKFPQGFVLGSETASTVSSRGVYHFPVKEYKVKKHDDFQSSSYDMEACPWSNLPEDDFILQDDFDWVLGEFVWTGFDYLGEPSPYNEEWPSRSSYFGICDLAGIPKDRFYLYKSRWNTQEETLHILPHWNWEGREGKVTPIYVYTNYNKAELFINGVSQGVRIKDKTKRLDRYRLRWMDTKYEAGVVKVVAYNDNDEIVVTEEIKTAGKPHHLRLEADRSTIKADGEDLSFVTVTVVDKNDNPCPTANIQLDFEVKGNSTFKAVCNGDATSLQLFHKPTMKTFNGKLVAIVQSSKSKGTSELVVKGKGVKSGSIKIQSIQKKDNSLTDK